MLAPHQEYAAAYSDNVIIFIQGWEEHLKALQAVLNELRKAGLTANLKKCALGQRETKYLCFLVRRGQIKSFMDWVQALKDYPLTHTKR